MPAPRTFRTGSRRDAAAEGRGSSRVARPAGAAPGAAALHEAALAHLARFAVTEAGLLRVLERRVDRWVRAATAEAEASPDSMGPGGTGPGGMGPGGTGPGGVGPGGMGPGGMGPGGMGPGGMGEASERIAAAAATAREAARGVVARLAAAGAVDDAAFAESRGRSLGRAGRSRRAALAHLQARGVASELARAAVPDDPEAELAAALGHARRRRLGPFATVPEDGAPDEDAAREGHRRALANMARAGFAQEVAGRALRLDRDTAEALLLARRRS